MRSKILPLALFFLSLAVSSAQMIKLSYNVTNTEIPYTPPKAGSTITRSTPADASYGTDFGVRLPGSTTSRTLTLENISGVDQIFALSFADNSSPFSLFGIPSVAIGPGKKANFSLRFDPEGPGTFTDLLKITSNTRPDIPFHLDLKGTTPLDSLSLLSPSGQNIPQNNFPQTGDQTAWEIGEGGSLSRVFSLSNDGNRSFPFVMTIEQGPLGIGVGDGTIATGESQNLRLTIRESTPETAGSYSQALRIYRKPSNTPPVLFATYHFQTTINPTAQILTKFVRRNGNTSVTNGINLFTSREIMTSSEPQRLRLCNEGSTTLSLESLTSDHEAFIVTPPVLPASLAPGATLDFNLSFSPTTPGSQSGTLTLVTEEFGDLVILTPIASGLVAELPFNSLSLTESRELLTPVGIPLTVTFPLTNTNTANIPLRVSEVSILSDGEPVPEVTISSIPETILPGDTFDLSVTFFPRRPIILVLHKS
jgi:archaellum component FlaF (FlaF/FlaG flagellin family)